MKSAAQDLRDRVRSLKYAFSEAYRHRYERPIDATTQMAEVARLAARAKTLADPRHRRQLESLRTATESAKRAIRTRAYDAALQPGYVLRHVESVVLKPAFKAGDRTSRGVVEHVGEYSTADGWLYGVRDSRGVFDRVWERTLVWRK